MSDHGLHSAQLQQDVIGIEDLCGQSRDFWPYHLGLFDPVGAASVPEVAPVLGQMFLDCLALPAWNSTVCVNVLVVVPDRDRV